MIEVEVNSADVKGRRSGGVASSTRFPGDAGSKSKAFHEMDNTAVGQMSDPTFFIQLA